MIINLQINDRPISVEKGTTLLQAARKYGIDIPTLCDYPGLPAHGSCRMCVVEIQGRAVTPTACTTLAEEGMLVLTHSPKVLALRSELLQMLLADHPSACLFCPERSRCDDCMVTLKKAAVTTGCRSCNKDTQCEIQKLVREFGLEELNYPGRYRMLSVQRGDPFIDRDQNLCILCGRCIRVCDENHFAPSIAYTQRGAESLVSPAFGQTLLAAGCSFCGACVEVCPTGSLSEKTRKWDGQPDQETSSTCPFCELGCQIRLLSKNGKVIGSLPTAEAGPASLCVLGRFGITELVNSPTRLLHPKKSTGSEMISLPWDESIRLAAEKISACDPGQFQLVISDSCTDEELYVSQKLLAALHPLKPASTTQGTPDSHPAQNDRLLARLQPLGDLSTVSTFLCLGLDGDFSQSVLTSKIHKAQKSGARLVWVNHQESQIARYADVWLRPGESDEVSTLDNVLKLLEMRSVYPGSDLPHDATGQAVECLESGGVTLLLAPAFLQNIHASYLISEIIALADRLGARLCLAPEGNGWGVQPQTIERSAQVLYLIGEKVPAWAENNTFVIYQNLAEPEIALKNSLLLPMAAFTETEGTRKDRFGDLRKFHAAVPPQGEALPGWQIIARIAQTMGLPGFDYPSLEAVQAEMAQEAAILHGTAPSSRLEYMGYPLSRWVEGLRWLAPESQQS